MYGYVPSDLRLYGFTKVESLHSPLNSSSFLLFLSAFAFISLQLHVLSYWSFSALQLNEIRSHLHPDVSSNTVFPLLASISN